MRAIALSDVHLGWQESQSKAFRDFLSNLPEVDYLLILGDFFEMWRRDLVGTVLENRDVLDQLKRIHEGGVEVVLVAGNHDKHFYNMGPPENYPVPFQWRMDFRIAVPGRTYVFKHGHQYDPSCQNEVLNEAICHTNDYEGKRLSDAGEGNIAEAARLANPANALRDSTVPYVPLRDRATLRRIKQPGLRDDGPNLAIIRQRARASIKPGEFLVHGHTHVPLLEANYADDGCWVHGRRDYVFIDDLDVSLRTWN